MKKFWGINFYRHNWGWFYKSDVYRLFYSDLEKITFSKYSYDSTSKTLSSEGLSRFHSWAKIEMNFYPKFLPKFQSHIRVSENNMTKKFTLIITPRKIDTSDLSLQWKKNYFIHYVSSNRVIQALFNIELKLFDGE
jgi:hypothetical protein